MVRSLEAGPNLGRWGGLAGERVCRTFYHFTRSLGVRIGGAGRVRSTGPGKTQKACAFRQISGHHRSSWNLQAMESSALPLGNKCF